MLRLRQPTNGHYPLGKLRAATISPSMSVNVVYSASVSFQTSKSLQPQFHHCCPSAQHPQTPLRWLGGDAAKSTSLYGFAVARPKIPPKQGQALVTKFEKIRQYIEKIELCTDGGLLCCARLIWQNKRGVRFQGSAQYQHFNREHIFQNTNIKTRNVLL